MQEFFTIRPLDEVIRYLAATAPLASHVIRLDAPLEGRVLAEDVLAHEDLPPCARSCMDGYAVCAADTFGASEANPSYLDCVGAVRIDRPAAFTLRRGQCASIVTGGCLPQGADAVVMVEHTLDMGAHCVEMQRAIPPRGNVMLQGEDAVAGAVVLPVGTTLRPQEIGLLAAVGATEIRVFDRPRVTIISTGDELVPPETVPRVGQVRDVNSFTLAAMVRQCGGVPRCLGLVPDTLDALCAALLGALDGADVVLLSGGSSVGVRDLTLEALQSLPDMELFCHGVALSPGKPLILARVGGVSLWGLPGQVTSAQVVMKILGQPFLRSLQGAKNVFVRTEWPSRRARLTRNVAAKQGREDFVRVRLTRTAEGAWEAEPVTGKSGLLRTLVRSQGLIHIPATQEGVLEGTMVDVLLLE